MALCPRQARHRHSLASESISIVLDLESPTRQARAPGDITGRSRTDPPHEPRESRLGSTPHSRRTLEAWHRYRRDERVSKYLVRRRKPPSQTWRTFLQNHL